MRRFFLIGVLALAGCQNIVGPFQHREPQRVDDPLISINEQERRGRDRLAVPEDKALGNPTFNVAPLTYIDRPGPHDR
jgi:hypothetical protein